MEPETAPPTETTPEGEQFFSSGVKPITLGDRLQSRTCRSMVPSRNPNAQQEPCDTGLFDGEADQKKVQWTFFPPNARKQLDMLDFLRAAKRGASFPPNLKE